MQTVKIGNTTYITSRADIFAHHAKCTGKHRKLKSKGAESRQYPVMGAIMTTAKYVAEYERLNVKKNLMPWDWQPLSTTPTVPEGVDSAWEVADAASDL
jgi:hypothetical protein